MLLAAGLAGCAASPQDYRNDKDQPLPSGQGAFGESFTWEWRKKDAKGVPITPTAPAADTNAAEQREFEEWRAWQEWKRKNPK